MSERQKRFSFAPSAFRNLRPSSSLQPLQPDSPASRHSRTSSPSHSYHDPYNSSQGHGSNMSDGLLPPRRPFSTVDGDGSALSSRRSSFSSDKKGERPPSLSINYLPAKFTRLHAPGDWAHRRSGKQGGGRDAFAKDASRMGMMGTVDDDEGVVYQLGKGGLKKKRPKLRWNRFKWTLFVANTVLIAYGIATLICAILVWLNVFTESDVIRVGNRTELIISTVAAAMMVLTSLIGYSGIVLNNRTFLAIYTLLLWVCLGLLVAPGYISYKQKTFNLEGKINLQWSRKLGTEGRLRIQNAMRCCGYFSPYVEATQSPLCYSRSNFPGCKNRYLKFERHVLTTWYTIAFALTPAHVLIIIAALLCSNHITYRFGKGLTPKRYRLDLGSMAVIMDEYAGQIAAQYGPEIANEAKNRSSISLPGSRHGSTTNLNTLGSTTGLSPGITRTSVHSRYGQPSGLSGRRGSSTMYDPSHGDSVDLDRNSVFDSNPSGGFGDDTHDQYGNSRYAQPGPSNDDREGAWRR